MKEKLKLLLDASVFPSNDVTIAVEDDPTYGGAHKYHIINCMGFNNGKTDYVRSSQGETFNDDIAESLISGTSPKQSAHTIQFIHKADNGDITPGLQSEQLVLVLLDRAKKLNARFPSEQNEKMIAGLQMFLDACKERVQDRIDRGVMGDLKK